MERLNECRKAKLEADRITKQIVELQEMGAPASEINKLWQMLLQKRTRWLKQFMEIDQIFGKMWSEVQQRLGYERVKTIKGPFLPISLASLTLRL